MKINSITKKIVTNYKAFLVFSSLLLLVAIINSCDAPKAVMDATTSNIAFSPNIPVDVDPALQNKLKSEGDIYALNLSLIHI